MKFFAFTLLYYTVFSAVATFGGEEKKLSSITETISQLNFDWPDDGIFVDYIQRKDFQDIVEFFNRDPALVTEQLRLNSKPSTNYCLVIAYAVGLTNSLDANCALLRGSVEVYEEGKINAGQLSEMIFPGYSINYTIAMNYNNPKIKSSLRKLEKLLERKDNEKLLRKITQTLNGKARRDVLMLAEGNQLSID